MKIDKQVLIQIWTVTPTQGSNWVQFSSKFMGYHKQFPSFLFSSYFRPRRCKPKVLAFCRSFNYSRYIWVIQNFYVFESWRDTHTCMILIATRKNANALLLRLFSIQCRQTFTEKHILKFNLGVAFIWYPVMDGTNIFSKQVKICQGFSAFASA